MFKRFSFFNQGALEKVKEVEQKIEKAVEEDVIDPIKDKTGMDTW